MTQKFRNVFGAGKPVIAMVHFGALPGSPLHDAKGGLDALIDGVTKDLDALQKAGVDAVMFGNENDRPYEFARSIPPRRPPWPIVIGQLRNEITVPFGVNVLWDPMASVPLALGERAPVLSSLREIFTGTYASDMGPWNARCRKGNALSRPARHRSDLALLYNVSRRVRLLAGPALAAPTGPAAAVFSSDSRMPSSSRAQITGEAAVDERPRGGKEGAADGTPVLANTGVKHATVADVLRDRRRRASSARR